MKKQDKIIFVCICIGFIITLFLGGAINQQLLYMQLEKTDFFAVGDKVFKSDNTTIQDICSSAGWGISNNVPIYTGDLHNFTYQDGK